MSPKDAFNKWWEENNQLVSVGNYTEISKKFTAYKAWEAGIKFSIMTLSALTSPNSGNELPDEISEAIIKRLMVGPQDFDEARIDRIASSHGDGEHYGELK